MSKSLGNVVDPLDVTSEYGCDALRYTLATGSTPGQDVNLSLDRVVSSRNLTNKIWNAAKFVQFGTQDLSQEEYQALAQASFCKRAELIRLPLPERWIVSRLHECGSTCLRLRCIFRGTLSHHVCVTISYFLFLTIDECAVLARKTGDARRSHLPRPAARCPVGQWLACKAP